jgi:hypothetical protein
MKDKILVPAEYWEVVFPITPRVMLFLILSSKAMLKLDLDLSYKEYIKLTENRLNNYRRSYIRIIKTVTENPPKKVYIKVPLWFFKIGLKNKYELLIAHYYITKIHNSKRGSPKLSYKDFIEKYNIPTQRRIKQKYEAIIKNLINNYEKKPNDEKEI